MKITVSEQPPIPKEVRNPETLAYYLASSLGLIPERGKGDVVIELLLLFRRISQMREGEVAVGNRSFPVKNGAMKVRDILEYLRLKGHQVSQSQLYSTYLKRFVEAGLITKRKGSMYGLRGQNYELTLEDVFHDLRKVWGKVVEHVRRLDEVMEEG